MKTSLKNKRITAIVVAFTLLMGGVLVQRQYLRQMNRLKNMKHIMN